MSQVPSAAEMVSSARWLAQATDSKASALRLIDMTRDAYRAASFLDDRILQTPVITQVRPFHEIAAAVPTGARSDARWIFHIGHVGSTLISRLLGELESVLAIREPRLLRDIAAMPPERRKLLTPTVQKLLSRTFSTEETALVKATSYISETAAELVPSGERALFLYVKADTYIATILAGDNSLKELSALAPARAKRMESRVDGLGPAATAADFAAAAWACEMTALEGAAAAMGHRRLRWVDFETVLRDVPKALAELTEFLGFRAPPQRVRDIAEGPLMSRYSKAPEFEYSPSLRRALIEQESRAHRGQIAGALAMLDQAAQVSPLLARALARSARSAECTE